MTTKPIATLALLLGCLLPAHAAVRAGAATTGSPGAGVPGEATRPVSPATANPGLEALDWAFRFASAIVSDEKDQAKSQEAVVGDYIQAGALDEAKTRTSRIQGWRRGTALADLAAAFGAAGRMEEARKALADAGEVRSAQKEGWQGPRIEAHEAAAESLMGNPAAVKDTVGRLAADDLEYAGRSFAIVATGYAHAGDFGKAMEEMSRIPATEKDIDVSWWRTAGYVAIAKEETLERKQRLDALAQARKSAESIPGWKRGEAYQSIAAEYRRLGETPPVRELLEAAEKDELALPDTMGVKSALLSNLARSWSQAGDTERARKLLKAAEAVVPGAMLTERSAVWSNLAGSWFAIGDAGMARETWGKAFDASDALVNARPRALAIVAICRSIGNNRAPLDEATRERLSRLMTGLREPW